MRLAGITALLSAWSAVRQRRRAGALRANVHSAADRGAPARRL